MNCYNSDAFLNEAIESVVNQTYTNWEIVFWDNKSTDDSAKIVKKFNDVRIKYFYAPTHTKLYESRNKAIKKCEGDLICFLDCDDVWVDNKLHTQTSCFKKGVDFVYGNYDVINENGKIVKESNKNLPTGFITNSLFDNNFISIGAVMISKELLINNLFNPKYNLLGDFELWIRISVKTQFVFLNNIVEHSRVHDNNTSRILYTDWIHEKRFFYYNFLKNYNFLKFHGVFKYIIRTELRVLYEKLIRIVKN